MIPGFTAEQKASFLATPREIRDKLNKALPPLPPVQSFESWCQQYTPPAPQARKEEDKQLLQQEGMHAGKEGALSLLI